MLTRSVKEARSTFSALIECVQKGETVCITRHGKQAACLVAANPGGATLPSLREFRAKITSAKSPLSSTVIHTRAEARF